MKYGWRGEFESFTLNAVINSKTEKSPRTPLRPLGWGLALVLCSCATAKKEIPWEEATAYPDRVTLCVTDAPATSQTVTWRTQSKVTSGYAEIALADGSPKFSDLSKRIEATTAPLDLSQFERNAPQVAHYHTVKFDGLSPDTLYAYRVGSNDSGWSEWFQFRTAAATASPFSLIYVGDAQNGILSHWSRLIRSAYSRDPGIDLMIHAGDLVNTGHLDSDWGEWYKGLGWTSGQVPFLAVPGNHEYSDLNGESQLSIQWQKQFEFPKVAALDPALGDTVYTVDYQGVRFIALNTLRAVEKQAEWLETVLSDNPNRWTIVVFHHPVFASAVDRDNLRLRQAWKPLFDKYSVDLILQGHDHTYARGNVAADGGPDAVRTVYVNSVSGQKMYTVKADRWDDYAEEGVVMDRSAENTQLFQWIRVDGDTIRYEARMATGEMYDAFQIRKAADGSKRLIEDPAPVTPERTFENTIGAK